MSSETTPHTRAACRAERHTRVQHLITADETSLVDLEMLLATLPLCATGRVFIEVPDASWASGIAAPGRMVVTWLDRSARTGEPGTGRACRRGEAVSRAANAWASEMLCGEEPQQAHVHLLGGFLGTADILDHLTEDLGFERSAVELPEWFPAAA